MALGGIFLLRPVGWRSTLRAAVIASPVAVPPLGVRRLSASSMSARSGVGLCSTRGRPLKAITPTLTPAGTPWTKWRGARRAATRREGLTSVASIEPDTSVASMIAARSTGTATVFCGLAAATISTASASANASIGAWRRHPGRRGATEASSAGAAKAVAARRRSRWARTYMTTATGIRISAARTTGAPKLIPSAPAGDRRRPRSGDGALSRALPRAPAELDVQRDGLAVAQDLDGHDVAGRLALDAGGDVRRAVHAPAVDPDDDVARLPAGAGGGAAGAHRAHDRAARPAVRCRGGDSAEVRAVDRLALLEPRHDLLHRVRRDREADADVAVAGLPGGLDLRVHADHARLEVEQRAAGVARVDRRVGLDDLVDRRAVGGADAAAEARDDARGGRAVEPERVADGDGGVADLHVARVGERQRVDVRRVGDRDLEHGEVGRRVRAEDRGEDAARVGAEAHRDLARASDDVRVRDERPVAVVQPAGPGGVAGADRHDRRARLGVDRPDRRLRRGRLGAGPGRGLLVLQERAGRERHDQQHERRDADPGQHEAAPALRRLGLGRRRGQFAQRRTLRRLLVAVRAPVAGPQVLGALHASASAGGRVRSLMSGSPQVYPSVGAKSSDAHKPFRRWP